MHRHHEQVAGVSPEVERPRHGDRAVGRDGEVLHGAREGEGQRLLAQLHFGVKHLHPRHERAHRRPLIHPNGARVIRRHAHRRFVHVLHQHGESHLRRSARSVHRANHQRVVADSLVVQRSDREHAARLAVHREVRTACNRVEHHRTLVLRVHCDHRRTNTHVLLHSDSHGLFLKHGRTVAAKDGHSDSSTVRETRRVMHTHPNDEGTLQGSVESRGENDARRIDRGNEGEHIAAVLLDRRICDAEVERAHVLVLHHRPNGDEGTNRS